MGAPRKEIRVEGLTPPYSHYTDAVQCGDFLLLSGAVSVDGEGTLVGAGDAAAQTRAICASIEQILAAGGMAVADIVYWRALLTDVAERERVDSVRREFLGETRPASTLFGVRGLVDPGLLVEIETVAYRPQAGSPREEVRAAGMYEPFGHAAHAVRTGDFLWISGQGPFDADGALVGAGDIAQQARQTLANMERVLGAAGMDFEDVAKVVVYLANPDDHALINPVRKEFFGPHIPVSTLFGVHSLPAGIGIEIEAVAYKPSAGAPPREEINVPIQDPPLSHYTDGVRCGDLLFLSGQGPFDVSFNLAGGDDVAAQAVKVHENLGAVLAAAGMGFEDMAKVTVYLSDVAERPLINPVRERFFGAHKPASTLFGVGRLALPRMRIEIDATAYRPR